MKKPVHHEDDTGEGDAFSRAAGESQPGIVKEFWAFLRHNKKWWLVPIIVVLLLAAIVILLAGSPLAPFLYPLF